MSGNTLKVAGLNDFRKGLRSMDRNLAKGVRLALNAVAEVVIDAARPEIPSVTGAARASLRANSSQSAARIAVGGPKAPYYPWLDFGGAVGRKKATVRRFYRAGRYIYPTLERKRDAVEAAMLNALAMLAVGAGVEVG